MSTHLIEEIGWMSGLRKCFSLDLKRSIVAEIEAGHISIREASLECQAGVSQVKQWLEEFGKYRPKRDVLEVVMKSEQDKIRELEKGKRRTSGAFSCSRLW
jgi:transposase-like protein